MSDEFSVATQFGERLRFFRTLKRLTQAGLAEKVGLSLKQISRIERGTSTPSFTLLEKLCRVLNIAPVTLFLFHGPSFSAGCRNPVHLADREATTHSDVELISVKSGAWIVSSASKRGAWSASLYALLGYAPYSVTPTVKRFLKHVHPPEREIVESFLRAPAQEPHERTLLVSLAGKGPERCMVMIQAEPWVDAAETKDGLLVIVREVTDCIALHRSFIHNQRQLEVYMLERNKELALTVQRLRQEVLEREKAEQGLRISDLMVASSQDAQIFVDRFGVVRKVNPAYARLAGISVRELEGRLYNDMLIERWGHVFFDRFLQPDMEKAQIHGQATVKEES
ncbi:PAS domain S-box-containing protein [Desulfonatronum zhilinae]|nr:PAS domain S-box-containing protein [Desulfonatronum zhilinae]